METENCINENCEFYDNNAEQNYGGDCGGEPAIASCKHSQSNEPRETLTSLKKQLTAALAERDEARSELEKYKTHGCWYIHPDNPHREECKNVTLLNGAREQCEKLKTSGWPGCLVMSQDTYNAGISAAWQQGAEAAKGAAVAEFQRLSTHDRETHQKLPIAEFRQWALDRLRALPVPERKEG